MENDFVAGKLGLKLRDLLLASGAFLVNIALLPADQRLVVDIRVALNVRVVRELQQSRIGLVQVRSGAMSARASSWSHLE